MLVCYHGNIPGDSGVLATGEIQPFPALTEWNYNNNIIHRLSLETVGEQQGSHGY